MTLEPFEVALCDIQQYQTAHGKRLVKRAHPDPIERRPSEGALLSLVHNFLTYLTFRIFYLERCQQHFTNSPVQARRGQNH